MISVSVPDIFRNHMNAYNIHMHMVFRVQTDGYYSVRSRGDLDNNSRSNSPNRPDRGTCSFGVHIIIKSI